MSDENTALNTEYEELEVQRTTPTYSNSEDLSSSYMSVEISLFGKVFISLMVASFILSLCLLIFSYTPYGRTFLRGLEISF
jgi:hypothetical protein